MTRVHYELLLALLLMVSGLALCSVIPALNTSKPTDVVPDGDVVRHDLQKRTGEGTKWDFSSHKQPDDEVNLWRNKGGRWLTLANVDQEHSDQVARLMRTGPMSPVMSRADLARSYQVTAVATDRDKRVIVGLGDYLEPEMKEGKLQVGVLPNGNFKVITTTGQVQSTMNKEFIYAVNPIDEIVVRMTNAPSGAQKPLGTMPRPQPPPMDNEESRVFTVVWSSVTSSTGKQRYNPLYGLRLPTGWGRGHDKETTLEKMASRRNKLQVFVDALINNANDLKIINTVLKRSQPSQVPVSVMASHPAGTPMFMAMMATTGGQLLSKILFENNKRDLWGHKIIVRVKISRDRPESPTVVWHLADWTKELEASCENLRGLSYPWKDRSLDGQQGKPGSVAAFMKPESQSTPQPPQVPGAATGQSMVGGAGGSGSTQPQTGTTTSSKGSSQHPGTVQDVFWYDPSLFNPEYSASGVPSPRWAYIDPQTEMQPGAMFTESPTALSFPDPASAQTGTRPGYQAPPPPHGGYQDNAATGQPPLRYKESYLASLSPDERRRLTGSSQYGEQVPPQRSANYGSYSGSQGTSNAPSQSFGYGSAQYGAPPNSQPESQPGSHYGQSQGPR